MTSETTAAPRVARRAGRWFAPVLALLLAAASAFGGDPAIAQTLLKTGKGLLDRKKYDDAVSHFQRAWEEDPNLVEAFYWKGVGQERLGAMADALESYREFLSLLADKVVAGKPTSEENKLKPKAERRVAALAAGEMEYAALEDAFAANLVKFASARGKKDPAIALRALDLLLALRPDHEAARKLYESLGGKPPEVRDDSPIPLPFRKAKAWIDYLGRRTFEGPPLVVAQPDGHMVFNSRTADRLVPLTSTDPGKKFAYEMEFRLQEAYGSNWLSGLTFAEKEGGRSEDFIAVFVQKTSIVIFSASTGGTAELARKELPAIDEKAWHRFGITVQDHLVECWLDGKSCLTYEIPAERDVRGVVGVYNQQCRAEWRLHRLGRL